MFFDKLKKAKEEKEGIINNGILFCSGMIAGEGLVGILLAVFAVFNIGSVINLSRFINLPTWAGNLLSLVVFGLIILSLLKFSLFKKAKKSDKE